MTIICFQRILLKHSDPSPKGGGICSGCLALFILTIVHLSARGCWPGFPDPGSPRPDRVNPFFNEFQNLEHGLFFTGKLYSFDPSGLGRYALEKILWTYVIVIFMTFYLSLLYPVPVMLSSFKSLCAIRQNVTFFSFEKLFKNQIPSSCSRCPWPAK